MTGNDCCVRATIGHAAAAAPMTRTSRRLMPSIGFSSSPVTTRSHRPRACVVGLQQGQGGSGRRASPWGSPEIFCLDVFANPAPRRHQTIPAQRAACDRLSGLPAICAR
jgi:hypothetical protein